MTQGARKALRISRQGSAATDGSIASESVTSLQAAASNITRAAAAPTGRRQNHHDHFPRGFQAGDYKQLVAGEQKSKKVGNPTVKDQFSLVFDDSTDEAGSVYRCVHCNAKTFTWKTFNSS
eukprot:scaffold64996_cov68-Attheya_sp.AAC.2